SVGRDYLSTHVIDLLPRSKSSVLRLWPKAADQQSTPMSWNVNSLVSVLAYCASGAVGYDHERWSAPREFNPLLRCRICRGMAYSREIKSLLPLTNFSIARACMP